MTQIVKRFMDDESGVTAIEYWSAPTEWSGCNVSGYTVSTLEA
jgi:hypothetical protein